MRYIKLYENWLNESTGEELLKSLDIGLTGYQKEIDGMLNELSRYGKLSEQIRQSLNTYRSQYLSSEVWSTVGTEQGLNNAFAKFKELYFKSIASKDATLKFSNVLKNVGKSGMLDQVKYAAEAKKASGIIKDGDAKLADSIAAAIILNQLSIAITKGLYYHSSAISLKGFYSDVYNTAKDYIDNVLREEPSQYLDIKHLRDIGSMLFQAQSVERRTEWSSTGRVAVQSNAVPITYFTNEKLTPFVENLSYPTIVNLMKTETWNALFSLLTVGGYLGERTYQNLDLASRFMEEGGEKWYQNIVS